MYSNSGYVLLTEIVARTSGMSFEEFTRKRLFEPLGLKNTVYRSNLREIVKNRALAYNKVRNGCRMAMLLDNARGRLRVAGGPALVAQSKDRFKRWCAFVQFMSQDKFEIQLLSPDEFELKSMEGKTTRYRRAQPYVPTADDLQAFAGRYESTGMGTVFQIESRGEVLLLRLERAPSRSLELKPVARDTFQIARITVRFRRDKAGKVIALDYSNPLIRNVKFTLLSDHK